MVRASEGEAADKPASMGPLPFSSGNVSVAAAVASWWSGFNGAAAFQQRKSYFCRKNENRMDGFNGAAAFQQRKSAEEIARLQIETTLQWGRCLSAAEIGRCRRMLLPLGAASMGPLPFSSGNAIASFLCSLAESASMGPLPFSSGNSSPRKSLRDIDLF